MSRLARFWCGVAAVFGLVVVMWLLAGSPTANAASSGGSEAATYTCESVLGTGRPQLTVPPEDTFYSEDESEPGPISNTQSISLSITCAAVRQTRLGQATLLAIPTTLLGAACLLGGPRRTRPGWQI